VSDETFFEPDPVTCRQLVAFASDYLDGVLSSERARAVAEHLAACAGCHDHIDQLRTTIELTRTAGQARPPGEYPGAPAHVREALLAAFRARRPQR